MEATESFGGAGKPQGRTGMALSKEKCLHASARFKLIRFDSFDVKSDPKRRA